MNGRERILALLDGKGVDRLPVMPITMMFAARQLGVSYRKYSNDYCSLVEGQISTAEKFGFDYVNTMSDPAREAADCGAKVEYFDDQPAALDGDEALLADKTALSSLKIPDPLGGSAAVYRSTIERVRDLSERLAVGLFGAEAVNPLPVVATHARHPHMRAVRDR
ncbi:MAG: uroporphyrinogen decarboxylase family protein [Limisphaerales bacterium]